ncbi:hypothetical protein ACXZ1K_01135 [Pedobacter sp. PWIIR3]
MNLKVGNTDLPNALKSEIDDLSNQSMDDVKVHHQGRVKPTLQNKDSINVNDGAGLEKEADSMGNLASEKTHRKNSLFS